MGISYTFNQVVPIYTSISGGTSLDSTRISAAMYTINKNIGFQVFKLSGTNANNDTTYTIYPNAGYF